MGKISFSHFVEFDEKSLFSRSSYVMKEIESGHLTMEIIKLRLPQAMTMESKNDWTKSKNSLPTTQSSASYINEFKPLQHNNEGKHTEGTILCNHIVNWSNIKFTTSRSL